MDNIYNLNFSQVKINEITKSTVDNLFTLFKVQYFLNKVGIVKIRGHLTITILSVFFLFIFEKYRSVYEGIRLIDIGIYNTTLNNFLLNTKYDWRKLQISIVKHYTKKYSPDTGKDCSLIADDTSKKKTGRLVEFMSQFYDHSTGSYFTGHQVVFLGWYNGRSCVPLDFVIKTGKKRFKEAKRGVYDILSHTHKRYKESRLKKTDIVINMIKRAMKHNILFTYVLWDSWYNCDKAYKYIFTKLVPRGKHLVSMVKQSSEKYRYENNGQTEDMPVNAIYKSIKKWKEMSNGIKFKSVTVGVTDKSKRKNRSITGLVKMCFFWFPGQKKGKYKVIICTNLELTAEEIFEKYTQRWSIEVMIKDIKQYMGYDQSKSSKYSALIADLSIRCICYTMLCSLKEREPRKSIYQIVLEFNKSFEDHCFEVFTKYVIKRTITVLVDYMVSIGISLPEDINIKLDEILLGFWNKDSYEDKIIETVDNGKKVRVA